MCWREGESLGEEAANASVAITGTMTIRVMQTLLLGRKKREEKASYLSEVIAGSEELGPLAASESISRSRKRTP